MLNIEKAEYLISSPTLAQCPPENKPEYAFIGRSNVGKSSLINMLTNKQNLAKTSAHPGKTKLINHFEIKSKDIASQQIEYWYLVDLPGYGFAKISQHERKQWQKMIADYLQNRQNLVMSFVLIDARHKPQTIDLDFINQLGEWRVPFALVFTKIDKEKPAIATKNVNTFLQTMQKNWASIPDYFTTSATKRIGRNEILNYIQQLNKGFIKKSFQP